MSQRVVFQLDLPEEMTGLKLPEGVDRRLHALLDRQDRGEPLSAAESLEAEGLVALAEMLSLMRLRSERLALSAGP